MTEHTTRSVTQFHFLRLRFHFLSQGGSLYYPPGKAGNIVRGALGNTLKQVACQPDCRDSKLCPSRGSCSYGRIFEPVDLDRTGPSGYLDQPRPFVLRANHLDGATFRAGDRFWFDIHLFLIKDPPIPHFILALAQLADAGLGPARGLVRLLAVDNLGFENTTVQRVFDDGRFVPNVEAAPLTIDLSESAPDANEAHNSSLTVRFHTPTEIKHAGKIAELPDFRLLIARACERVSNLAALYGPAPLVFDWRALIEAAKDIRIADSQLQALSVERYSTRTGQRHSLGGFCGQISYEGPELLRFVPLLRAAAFCGVGRHTVWGNGAFDVK